MYRKNDSEVKESLSQAAAYTEEHLNARIEKYKNDSVMGEAMAYSLLSGGKRIRAFLTLEFCKYYGGTYEQAEPYASAVEMVHAYSLIHDDLPAMDNDDMRRGKPSCHKAYGETVALLAGDALLTLAFETAAEGKYNTAAAVAALARGAGAAGMCRGQELDLSCDCKDINELFRLHNLKTGALINAAAVLGYLASGVVPEQTELDKIANYAYSVGLAFQITDDLLDVRSTTEELGKPVGSDEKNNKKTVLSFCSEEEADAKAFQLSRNAADIYAGETGGEILSGLPMLLYSRKK